MSVITLPSGVEVYEGKVLVIPGIGALMPIGDLTPAEVQALRDDVVAAFNQELGDLANVSESGKTEGMVLGVGSDGTWEPSQLVGVIERVATNWNENEKLGVKLVTVGPGIDVNPNLGTTRAHLQLVFGASGSSDTVARADHRHPPTLSGVIPFDQGGSTLSSGSSMFVAQPVTGLVSSVVYDISVVGRVEAVNSNQSGRLRLHVQIGSDTARSISAGFSGGVWSQRSIARTRMAFTGATSTMLQFWASYESGDPTALYAGEVQYTFSPRGGMS